MNANSHKDHLSWIATVAIFVIACVYIFSQPVVLQKFRPTANKVNTEEANNLAGMLDDPFIVFRLERPSKFMQD